MTLIQKLASIIQTFAEEGPEGFDHTDALARILSATPSRTWADLDAKEKAARQYARAAINDDDYDESDMSKICPEATALFASLLNDLKWLLANSEVAIAA
jgi:hypothetical protein